MEYWNGRHLQWHVSKCSFSTSSFLSWIGESFGKWTEITLVTSKYFPPLNNTSALLYVAVLGVDPPLERGWIPSLGCTKLRPDPIVEKAAHEAPSGQPACLPLTNSPFHRQQLMEHILFWMTTASFSLTLQCVSPIPPPWPCIQTVPQNPPWACHAGARAKHSAPSTYSHHLAYQGASHDAHQAIWICVFKDDILVRGSGLFFHLK